MDLADAPEIVAAGAVVSRRGRQVLLVHRPKHRDWSFPKGKLDADEHPLAAAVREVAEETGVSVRLGPPLPDQEYLVAGDDGRPRPKRVHYWVGRPVGDTDVASYSRNDEIDDVGWFDVDEARDRLTYERDRATLTAFEGLRRRTTPLVVLRHAQARSRDRWRGNDRKRPLSTAGELQSDGLVPLLAAYGVQRILSSSSRRCWTTLAPYAHVTDVDLHVTDALSEEDADPDGVAESVHGLLLDRTPAVLCTHRKVLPLVWSVLGAPAVRLEPAGMLVVHHRNGQLVAVEPHHL